MYTLVWEDDAGVFPLGYMPRAVFRLLLKMPVRIKGEMDFSPDARTVSLRQLQQEPSEAERTKRMARITEHWRTAAGEADALRILHGWRDELWPVYGRHGELLFSMERAAVGLFGAMRYGVHMTAYVRCSSATKDNIKGDVASKTTNYSLRIWVAKRAATKESFPSMLDNTAAGGLATADSDPAECMLREADEEASLPPALLRERLREVGTISYVYVTDERSGQAGLVYPEVQWVYDAELPADGSVVPRPRDGEAEGFALCTVEEVQDQLARGLFKPNCAVIMLDFFVRHGILTAENEPHYKELKRRMHKKMPFPGPHRVYEEKACT